MASSLPAIKVSFVACVNYVANVMRPLASGCKRSEIVYTYRIEVASNLPFLYVTTYIVYSVNVYI